MLRRNPMPPHIRQGIRTAVGVGIACAIGYGIVLPIEGFKVGSDIAKACKWAAITIVVVTVPVLGKVAQVSFERTLGTIIGGLLGWLTYDFGSHIWNTATDGWILSGVTALFAYACVMAAKRFKLDTSAKLSTITFVLVTFGGDDHGPDGALVTALWRITGIMFGVFLSLLLSVILYPKSAALSAVWELKTALDCLQKLGDICWKTQTIFQQELLQKMIATSAATPENVNGSQYTPLPATDLEAMAEAALKQGPTNVAETYQEEAENRLNDLYNTLAKCKDMCQQANNEILVGVFKGRWCFLPGSSCLKRQAWRTFQTDIDNAATQVRKCSRLLWMLHINFEEGFDENMRSLLKQQYPASLFPSLIDSCNGVLADLAKAWPNADVVPTNHLDVFVRVVSAITAISDYNRRRVLRHMCRYRYVGQGVGDAPEQPAFRPLTQLGTMLRRMSTGIGARSQSGPLSPPGALASMGPTQRTIVEGEPAVDLDATVDCKLPFLGAQSPGTYSSVRSREPSAGDLVQHHLDAVAGASTPFDGALPGPSEEHTTLTFSPNKVDAGPGSPQWAPGDSGSLSWTPGRDPGAPMLAGCGSTDSHHTTSTGRLRNFTAEDEFMGRPEDAFEDLEGVKIQVAGSPGGLTPKPSFIVAEDAGATEGDAPDRPLYMKIPHTASYKLALFPETSEGHVSQVRWYSFQFLLEELAEQLDETVIAFNALLGHIRAVEQDADGWVWM